MSGGRAGFGAYADAAARSALAGLLPVLAPDRSIPDWLVMDCRAPRLADRPRPGRGYLGWECELDAAWRGETRRAA